VSKQAAEKLDAGDGGAAHRLRAIVTITKRDVVVVDLFQAAVTDRDAEQIAGQVVENARAVAGGLGVNDPGCAPDRRGHLIEHAGLFHSRAHLRANDHRHRADRHEKGGMLRANPLCAIGREPAGGDDEMDMWVVEQGARLGVEDADAAKRGADRAGIVREVLHGRGGTAHQRPRDERLMAERERAQLRRQRDGDQVVKTGQQPRPMAIEPALRLIPTTPRAVPVAAGMIAVHLAPHAVHCVSCPPHAAVRQATRSRSTRA
jgi:hypothetical protein